VADASRKFEEQWVIFASGKNPATVKEEEQAAEEAAPTVKTLVEDYLKRHAEVNKKSWLDDKRMLENEILGIQAERQRQAEFLPAVFDDYSYFPGCHNVWWHGGIKTKPPLSKYRIV
jgi:hypothetical protein